ncbi:MAG: HIT domain-containing protein [Patescibacteria group bacterium]|nr:HIT domain-containing protein [Patescibacteria group bacterium]
MGGCLFCKFAKHEIPKEFIYEDNDVMVFKDIHPVRPVHLLIVPKEHIGDFLLLKNEVLWVKLSKIIQKIIKDQKLEKKGYRLGINGGGAQIIEHLHIHLMAPVGKTAKL